MLCVVRGSNATAADADQVPAGLHLPASRADVTCPLLYSHTDYLFSGHVGHQECQGDKHRFPSHGIATLIESHSLSYTLNCSICDVLGRIMAALLFVK